MKFKIESTSCRFRDEFGKRYLNKLTRLGFSLHKEVHNKKDVYGESYTLVYYFIEIDTLEELMKIREALDIELVVGKFDYLGEDVLGIEIYDDYRE